MTSEAKTLNYVIILAFVEYMMIVPPLCLGSVAAFNVILDQFTGMCLKVVGICSVFNNDNR